MIKNSTFEELKKLYIPMAECLTSANSEELSIDILINLDVEFERNMTRLQDAVILLKKARDAEDDLTIRAALVYIKIFAMDLSGFFTNIENDTLLLSRALNSSEMPANYSIPEHYKFPHN